ncbi:MAG: AmmeMemoRadiSam system protein B [Anaerolineae bacterium]
MQKPKIRNISIRRSYYQGEPVFLMQDSLHLTEGAIVLPQALGPLVLLCDGSHTLPEIQAALEVRYGLRLSSDLLQSLISQFDQALLLEGKTFEQANQRAVADYRAAPYRQPLSAGHSYPADPEKLRQTLQGYLNQVNGAITTNPTYRGMISPHIDYGRGGPVYAQVWASMAEAIRQAELVIILGTDHNGGTPASLTLTCQSYATPLGIVPTDQALVGRIAQALDPQTVFAGELLHRGEWSIELVLVWLQYLRGDNPCPVLPVLVGSFHHFMTGQAKIDEETNFKVFLDVLHAEMAQRRTLIVASGDLAHLGPEFDTPPLDKPAQIQMEQDDRALLATLCEGQADAFFDFMQAGQYERNVCGLSPFYFSMNLLGQAQGKTIAYGRCPAEPNGRGFNPNGASFVSVCGLVWE